MFPPGRLARAAGASGGMARVRERRNIRGTNRPVAGHRRTCHNRPAAGRARMVPRSAPTGRAGSYRTFLSRRRRAAARSGSAPRPDRTAGCQHRPAARAGARPAAKTDGIKQIDEGDHPACRGSRLRGERLSTVSPRPVHGPLVTFSTAPHPGLAKCPRSGTGGTFGPATAAAAAADSPLLGTFVPGEAGPDLADCGHVRLARGPACPRLPHGER